MNHPSRREFLLKVGAAAASMGPLAALPGSTGCSLMKEKEKRRPNVILVMTDDQGYGDLGCHGNPILRTPNLDRLHDRSVRLTDFHVGPTCSPTRASLLTGRYCNRTGVWHTIMGRSLLRKDEITLADVFSKSGYRTGIFGKWHLGDNYPFRPHDRGFDDALVHGGGAIGNTPDTFGNDYFDDTYFRNGKPEKHTGYCTDVWFDEAMKFIEANREQPFFCYLPTNAAHGPYRVPEKYSDMYLGDENVPNANFYGMITNIDENMGRLIDKLKHLGLEDDTILIFMTDNGTAAGTVKGKGYNAGMRGAKGSQYDGGHRVPFFIHWPAGGMAGGLDINRITAHIDLAPTLIEMCGLEKPDGLQFDGSSLSPLLNGKGEGWPDRVLITDSQRIEKPEKWRRSAVMTDRWRLIDGQELYDMHADPGQKNDLAWMSPGAVSELRQAYEGWWADTSTRFDEYCEIIVGSKHENPSRLTCHDWHENGPWDHSQVLRGQKGNGFWALDVAEEGNYEIDLRRWPEEADAPITASLPNGKALHITSAKLKVDDFDESRPVDPDARAVRFSVKLRKGKTKLQTWLMDEGGESRGAYYVYVRRLE
jgi:arylsulfatase A-like enzyme